VRPWVLALDCVFADGTRAVVRRGEPAPADIPAIARFLRDVAPAVRSADPTSLRHEQVRKESSGYALSEFVARREVIDVLVGSEGTLALFVGVELALCPRPAVTASLLAAFSSLDAAVAGAAAACAAGACACELLDRTFLDLVREATDAGAAPPMVLDDAEAVLLIEMEGASMALVAEETHALARTLSGVGAAVTLALDAASERALWQLRHAASPALARLDPALKSMQFIEDGAVPPARLADYVRGVRAALAHHGVRGAIFGHAGDAHVHVNPLIDVRRPHWRNQVAGLLADVTALTARLGGTLTGEHGDGRLRAPLLEAVWGGAESSALHLFAAVKTAFDPNGLLNPGVKVPAPGEDGLGAIEDGLGAIEDGLGAIEDGIGAIKYDPALAPLPDTARRALDRVADQRAYATPRLDLLAP